MNTKNGGPAFPATPNDGTGGPTHYFEGMTLRDWFAGQVLPTAMSAYLAGNQCGCAVDHALRNVPALVYKYADAMLAEREKGGA